MTPSQEFEAVAKWCPTDVLRLLIQQQRRRYAGGMPEAAMSSSPLDKVAATREVPYRCEFRRAIRWAMETPDIEWEKILRDNYRPQ